MKVRNMALCALFAALLAVCAWISIPAGDIAITMQTFGIFLTLGVLGGKRGTIAIATYLLLGVVGLPVFSGFQGGAAVLLGPTGGFLWGFLAAALVYWMVQGLGNLTAMAAAMAVCYLCGCLWFSHYAGAGLAESFAVCVLPYLIPDALKLWLAWSVSRRLRKYIRYA